MKGIIGVINMEFNEELYKYVANHVPAFNDEYCIEAEDESYILLNTELGIITNINVMAYEIMSQIDGVKNIGNIIDYILKEYDEVEKETLFFDVMNFFQELFNSNIIYWV